MRAYDLLIRGPQPSSFIVTALTDESARSLARESLEVDYAGEIDPVVLASRVSLVARVSGQAVLEAAVTDVLAFARACERRPRDGQIAVSSRRNTCPTPCASAH